MRLTRQPISRSLRLEVRDGRERRAAGRNGKVEARGRMRDGIRDDDPPDLLGVKGPLPRDVDLLSVIVPLLEILRLDRHLTKADCGVPLLSTRRGLRQRESKREDKPAWRASEGWTSAFLKKEPLERSLSGPWITNSTRPTRSDSSIRPKSRKTSVEEAAKSVRIGARQPRQSEGTARGPYSCDEAR